MYSHFRSISVGFWNKMIKSTHIGPLNNYKVDFIPFCIRVSVYFSSFSCLMGEYISKNTLYY